VRCVWVCVGVCVGVWVCVCVGVCGVCGGVGVCGVCGVTGHGPTNPDWTGYGPAVYVRARLQRSHNEVP
jgi:hypothetical protein